MNPIKVLIADDHEIVRDGLRSLFEKQPDISVIAEASDGWQAIEYAKKLSPDVVLMDVNLPRLNGIEATTELSKSSPNTKIIALSMRCDKQVIGDMLRAGASGYLQKDVAFRELARAIRTVMQGRIYLSPVAAEMVVDGFVRHASEGEATNGNLLTAKEKQVLQLVAEGKSNKQIASIMDIGMKTVDTHRQHLMARLNLHSVAELTKYAIREGITSVEE